MVELTKEGRNNRMNGAREHPGPGIHEMVSIGKLINQLDRKIHKVGLLTVNTREPKDALRRAIKERVASVNEALDDLIYEAIR